MVGKVTKSLTVLTLIASMAYSTWKRRPSGENVLTPLSYSLLRNQKNATPIHSLHTTPHTFPSTDQHPPKHLSLSHTSIRDFETLTTFNNDNKKGLKETTQEGKEKGQNKTPPSPPPAKKGGKEQKELPKTLLKTWWARSVSETDRTNPR